MKNDKINQTPTTFSVLHTAPNPIMRGTFSKEHPMARSVLKQLAKNAKNRLRNGYLYEEYTKNSLPSVEKEEKRVYQKVVEIMRSPAPVTNPLGLLIEENVFRMLSPEERERYVLELSKTYLRMTEKYLRSQSEED